MYHRIWNSQAPVLDVATDTVKPINTQKNTVVNDSATFEVIPPTPKSASKSTATIPTSQPIAIPVYTPVVITPKPAPVSSGLYKNGQYFF